MKKVFAIILSLILISSFTIVAFAIPEKTNDGFEELTTLTSVYNKGLDKNFAVVNGIVLRPSDGLDATVNYDELSRTYFVDVNNNTNFDISVCFVFEKINYIGETPFSYKPEYITGLTCSSLYGPDIYKDTKDGSIQLSEVIIHVKSNGSNDKPFAKIRLDSADTSDQPRYLQIEGRPLNRKDSSFTQPTENDINTSVMRERLAVQGVVPVTVYNSANAMSVDTMSYIGTLSGKSGLEVTNGDATFKFTGGFKVNEPGRLYYPLAYEPNSRFEADMLKIVKPDAKTDTCKLGGDYTLPKAATITVKTTLPEGSEAYIYTYVADPLPGKVTLVGKAKVVGGKLTFDAKTLGEFIFTTEKI